jgi:hypothetical protein
LNFRARWGVRRGTCGWERRIREAEAQARDERRQLGWQHCLFGEVGGFGVGGGGEEEEECGQWLDRQADAPRLRQGQRKHRAGKEGDERGTLRRRHLSSIALCARQAEAGGFG